MSRSQALYDRLIGPEIEHRTMPAPTFCPKCGTRLRGDTVMDGHGAMARVAVCLVCSWTREFAVPLKPPRQLTGDDLKPRRGRPPKS